MAEEPEVTEEGAAEEAPKKKKGKLFLLIGVGVVLVLVAAGAGLYFTGFFGGGEDKKAEAAKVEKKDPIYYDLPDMLVNLNTGGHKASFLKVTISLEIEDPEASKKLDEMKPRITDTFQTYLRELRPEDLKGSAGLFRLREELSTRVNLAVAPIKVDDVLFREMLVQ